MNRNKWMAMVQSFESKHNANYNIDIAKQHFVYMSCSSGVVRQSVFFLCSLSIFLFHSALPLGSFYPIKFIKSNMWMWHQRHRQLCYLHFAYWYVRTMCVRAFCHSFFLVSFFCRLQWKLNVVHNACVSIWIADVFCFFRCICSFCSSILNCFAYTWPDDAMHLLDGDFSDD